MAILTFAGTRMGRSSAATSAVVALAVPTTVIVVPTGGAFPITCSARVIVLKLQLGVAVVPTLPLPDAVASTPLTGSTKY